MNRLSFCRVFFAVSTMAAASNCANAQPPESNNIPPRTIAPERAKFGPAAPLIAPEIAADEWQVREIAIKNLPVRMMAWCLDAEHNTEPLSFQQSRLNQQATGYHDFPKPQRVFETLPVGANSVVVASEARNSIAVVGTLQGIETVADAIKKFDKPLQQIEVEMQAIQISETDANSLGLKFSVLDGAINAGRATPITLARATDSEALRLKVRDLMFWDQAKIVSSPRVTAINGLTARLTNAETTPFVMSFDKKGHFPKPLLDSPDEAAAAILYLTTASGLTVTPSVNKNGTITLDLMPAKTLSVGVSGLQAQTEQAQVKQIQAADATHEFFNPYAHAPVTTLGTMTAPVGTLEGFRYQLSLANNETVAFGGVSTALYATSEDKNLPANIILLVTARILPRYEEDETPNN